MSGGEAFVYDPNKELERKCNLDTFELEELINENDLNGLKRAYREALQIYRF